MANLKPNLSLVVMHCKPEAIEDTLEFYRTLGFEFKEEDHKPCGIHYSSESAGVTLEIYLSPFEFYKKPPIGFKYKNLDEVLENVDERYHGRDKIGEDGKRVVRLLDPDGRLVILTEEKNG